MFTVILLAALAQPPGTPAPNPPMIVSTQAVSAPLPAQPPGTPAPNPPAGLPPFQAVASIDAQGTLAIARVNSVCGYGMGDQEVWLKTPEKKPGEKLMVKAKLTKLVVSVVELPAHVVKAYSVDGKPIAPPKLAELLAKERTVLISLDGKKVDPFHLQLYKEGTIVLVPPANLVGLEYGPYLNPGSNYGPGKTPNPPSDKGKCDSLPVDEVSADAGDKKADAPDALPPGSIAAALHVRDKLPQSYPPGASEVVMKDGTLVVISQAILVETLQVKETEERDGKPWEIIRTVLRYKSQWSKRTVSAEKVKSFVVTKDGKLEPLDAAKLPDMLNKPTTVLVGVSADLDLRHLELIRPGTVYLAIPTEAYQQLPGPKDPPASKQELEKGSK